MNRRLAMLRDLSDGAGFAAITTARAQVGFDRPGGDYANAPVRSGDPARLRHSAATATIAAAPGASPIRARRRARRCAGSRIRSRRPRKTVCCVSGVRGAAVVEPKTGPTRILDRSRRRRLQVARRRTPTRPATSCAKACQADGKCRAFTYVRPGYGGASARCYLKDRITRPRRKPCCISGVVR